MTDILQAVRPHGKIDLAVNVSGDIDQTLSDALGIGSIAFCELFYRSEFVTAVMIEWCIRVVRDRVYKLVPYVAFVLIRIRPERVVFCSISLTHEQADQV